MDYDRVQTEHERLGYQQGWVFAMTPVANLATADVVLVGLNPGGRGHDNNDGAWEASGNAYLDQRWFKDGRDELFPIQVEVAELMKLMGVEGPQFFAGMFIPFRSPGLAELGRKEEAVAFARELWKWVLAQTPARTFVCMGQEAAWHIAQLIGGSHAEAFQTGWGETKAHRYVSPDGRVVVSLPHPSRYVLLGSARSPEKLREAKLAILQAARLAPILTQSHADSGDGHADAVPV